MKAILFAASVLACVAFAPVSRYINKPTAGIHRPFNGSVYIYDGLGAKVTALSGIDGFTFTAPLESMHSESGTHTGPAPVGSNVSFTLGPAGGASGYACLDIAGYTVQELTISGIGTYNFSSEPYNAGDAIMISFSTTDCTLQ
ncbi:MAG TPA: hypothetical protein VL547_00105 [Dinghuibacter sp.]|jgi:hypothetical protein|uniref:hypothetical protein n=1 Tax=Dinghuibacter sp. TaxID=2024697 RepID=UPI002D051147|nr:hypothetical protein [Dinghuibacter sp.]HTJ10388.1 hypothetical protein [Dinghuibacter sp.]